MERIYYDMDGMDGTTKIKKIDKDVLSGKNYYTKNYRDEVQKTREKLYFGKETEHINISEIESKIKENIESYSKWISEYVNVINSFIDNKFKLETDKIIFDIKRKYSENSGYEDDGNTQCEGFEYNVIWAYPLGDYSSDEWNIRQGFAEGFLYFVYEDQERIFDHKTQMSRFFSIYLAGVKLPREDKHIKRIDYNNNNMSLNSVLNKGNLVTIITKIQELRKKVELIKQLESINLFKYSEED